MLPYLSQSFFQYFQAIWEQVADTKTSKYFNRFLLNIFLQSHTQICKCNIQNFYLKYNNWINIQIFSSCLNNDFYIFFPT